MLFFCFWRSDTALSFCFISGEFLSFRVIWSVCVGLFCVIIIIFGAKKTGVFMSQLLDRAVDELSKLPGIGERTALRLALHLLRQPLEGVEALSSSLIDFRRNIKRCRMCNNLSDTDLCPICSDTTRDRSTICVVEQVKDVLTIEHTRGYRGLYHVLGGVISPMDGIGPSDLKVGLLVDNVRRGGVTEVILALSTSIEGETTSYYISRQLAETGVKVTAIARGIGFGDEIDYADDVTLVHALSNRRAL